MYGARKQVSKFFPEYFQFKLLFSFGESYFVHSQQTFVGGETIQIEKPNDRKSEQKSSF